MIKKLSDIGKEVENKNDDLIVSAIQNVSKGIENISQRQLTFENQTTEAYNKLAEVVADLRKELGKTNPVAQTEKVEVNGVQMNDVSTSGVDKNGVSWGGTNTDEFAGQKVAMKKPNADQTLLSKIGLDADSAALIVNKIIDSIMNKGTGNMGQIMNEFMVRDFFENYQKGKLYEKANLQLLMRKGLLSEDDVKPVLENSNTLNDPINKRIQAMKGVNPNATK